MEKIKDNLIYQKAETLLKMAYGEDAVFRHGQYQAIEAALTKKKALIVQKTGWGKSLVYFISTKINRDMGNGVTIVVSPLLVLMQNQLEAAKKIGLNCQVLNSRTKDIRQQILNDIANEKYDLVLITPETLFCEDVEKSFNYNQIRIGMLAIDEAHCISDWGHDFRLEYGKLSKIVCKLSSKIPILATTATANDRVVADLKKQLGDDVYVSRGSLFRPSLAIQVIKTKDKATRYAWILANIEKLPGSGIIYCLTTKDCDYLADFLQANGINAVSYHAGIDSEINIQSEISFKNNQIKVLVSTIKLGMGYDKDDIGFVIHFQRPANIVSYYQQIGRAGRKLDYAPIFLMSGNEDDDIQNYFIDTAFPYEDESISVLTVIEQNPDCNIGFITSKVNMRRSRVAKTVAFLVNEGFVFENKRKYSRSIKDFVYNSDYYEQIKEMRRKEQEQMRQLISTNECYSKFIINCLDDKSDINCGKCSNCMKKDIIEQNVDIEYKEIASRYINNNILTIKPKVFWAKTDITDYKKMDFINQWGACLSRWGDVGYGQIIRDCKVNNIEYPDQIIERAAQILCEVVNQRQVRIITYVPSKSNDLLQSLCQSLATKLGIKSMQLLTKTKDTHQIDMNNSSYQCLNALNSYEVTCRVPSEDIILIDDVIDSGWTLTVCGFKLMQNGSTAVIPFALTDISQKEGE